MHIILIGLPGAGKSTVGRILASRLGLPFLDFDPEIEQSFGKTVSEIFAEHGEPAFREAEVALSRRLAGSAQSVLAPGGGWAANLQAVAHLRPVSRIIYLRVSPEEAVRRLGGGVAKRPLFAQGSPSEVMQRLYDSRRAQYDSVADLVIDADVLGADALSAQIVGLVSRSGR